MTTIARTDLDIFPLNLGANPFGWTSDREATFASLDAFVAAGGNFVDTADSYSAWAEGNSGGESETLIGQWLASRGSDQLVVATKSGGLDGVKGRSRRATQEAVDASLRRLGLDTIDVFYYHYDDEDVPVADQIEIASDLIAAGKIRHLALSNYSPERMREFFAASAGTPAAPVAIQPQYNLLHRAEYESGYKPLAEEYSASVFPYFALASGMLTGKYRGVEDLSGASREAMASGYATDDGFAVVDALVGVADAVGAEPATVALAWLLAKGVTAPIASVSRPEQLPALMAAPQLRLDDEHLAALDQASAPFTAERA